MKRTSIALLSSAWVFALFLMAEVPVAPAYAGTVCEDGECPTSESPPAKQVIGDDELDDSGGPF